MAEIVKGSFCRVEGVPHEPRSIRTGHSQWATRCRNGPTQILTPAAQRALAEAEARRHAYDRQAASAAPIREINGRDGPEAVRYGDWEVKGIASDF